MKKPLIFNIQRYCTHDGPGIRTVVFLKGCPLRCTWCSNPESQAVSVNILFTERKCIGCGLCVKHCPQAIAVGRQGIDENCNRCGKCVTACPARALEFDGFERSIDEVLDEVIKDETYYYPGGGVTISGGEPLLFPDYVCELSKAIKSQGYHLAIETTGLADGEIADRVFSHMDLLLYDIKHMDDEKHKKYTGVSNQAILRNARNAARKGCEMMIRIPLLGGINDDDENMTKTAEFCDELNIRNVEILSYHKFGEAKYAMLRKEYDCDAVTPTSERKAAIAEIFRARGIELKGVEEPK